MIALQTWVEHLATGESRLATVESSEPVPVPIATNAAALDGGHAVSGSGVV